MTEKPKPRRLSETVIPGKDFAAKVKIDMILDQEVVILNIEKVSGSPEFALADPETGEIITRDYWNITVALDESILTFSCGAIPVNKVFDALQTKMDSKEAELPLLATFRKSGRTYIVE